VGKLLEHEEGMQVLIEKYMALVCNELLVC
jgi:hypothetical protein